MGRIKILLTLLILFTGYNSFSQELIYDVSIDGKPVGNTMVTKKVLDSGKVYYSALMDLEYKLFRPTQMVQLREAIFQNDTLIQAYFIDKRNGEKVKEAKIEQLKERKYYRTTIDTAKSWYEEPIFNSLTMLYFNQPKSRDSAFSESTHQQLKIAKLPEENRYMMVNDENEKSILKYNNSGFIQKLTFNIGAVKYELNLSGREK